VLIKICGLTSLRDAANAVDAGADLLGFVFVPNTPRAIEPARCSWVRDLAGAHTVGVFRNQPLEHILAIRDQLGLDWVQLHGEEPDTYLEALGHDVIRRLPVDPPIDWVRVAELSARCLPLFDPGAGDGVEWGWSVLGDRPPNVRCGLAGGLVPERVAEAVRTVRPGLVDVSSGVERAPGIKDQDRVRDFVAAARTASRSADG
jgi:phosphoribosylanthranilate isomerase